jgi:hypothetical protein
LKRWVGCETIVSMRGLGLGIAIGLVTLGGCADDDSKATTTDDDTATTSTAGSGTSTPTSTSAITSSSGDGTGTSSPGTTSTTGTSGTTGDDTYLCNGWQDGAAAPFLNLYADESLRTPLNSGDTVGISCGGQGSWMFALYPEMGGWRPSSGLITFSVDVQVDGFTGPTGQFYLAPTYLYGIECSSGGDTFDGGFSHSCLAILPPDEYLADLSVLDGATATIHVDMLDDGGTPIASIDLTDVTLSAPMRVVSEDCFF